MTYDTVFNGEMRVVFSDEPDVVLRRLKAKHPDSWMKVCIGETNLIVTIPEYLYREKFGAVEELVREVLKRRDLPMFKRHPERLDAHIQRTVHQIIKIAQGDQ
jgi:hypothetical protein